MDDVLRISHYFFENESTVSLPSRFDFPLWYAMLYRLEDKRHAYVSDLFLYELDNEGHTPLHALLLSLSHSKTNQEGRMGIVAAIRHKDINQCPVGALAFYLFSRFHLNFEPVPDLSINRAWHDIRMLRARPGLSLPSTARNGRLETTSMDPSTSSLAKKHMLCEVKVRKTHSILDISILRGS
jgi:hypothetical protein